MSVNQVSPSRNSEESTEIVGYDGGGGLSAVQQSLAVSLARAEVDQQVATARAMPRSIQRAVNQITTLATLDEDTAAECIYALPRGGKTIQGPSIRFAEIMASQWGNCRVAARIVHVDRIEKYVEAEGVFQDLETNVIQVARVRRPIQEKRGKGIDNDMIQLAGAAACSIARRNAILAGIPKGVARRGYTAVEEVIRGDIKTLSSRRALAIKAFGVMGVTPDRVFAALGVQGEGDINLDHLLTLNGARAAIKNGEVTVEEAFPVAAKPGERPASLADALDKMAGVGANEKVDPDTGEITKNGNADYVAASSDGRLNGAINDKPAGNGAANGTDAASSRPAASAEGAGTEHDSGPAPTDPNAALLADLTQTARARADAGPAALRDFLDNLEPGERKLLSRELVDALVAHAKTKMKPATSRA